MSDNLRRYRAIHDALSQWYPGDPSGNRARHLTTMAALISGIVASQSSQFPRMASKVPNGTKPESRVKRFTRWVDNERVTKTVYFLPYAQLLLAGLGLETLVLAIDGSTVGRGCVALMVSVIYKGRALPLAVGAGGEKGPFSRADAHRTHRAGSALGSIGCRSGTGR